MKSKSETGVVNSKWHAYRSSNTVIVFIHGFLSNSTNCWTSKNNEFWPNLVAKDPIFENPSIFLGGYYTARGSLAYDIPQCVLEVRQSLKWKEPEKKAPIDFDNIIFVCHSLGGIICRRLLESSAEMFTRKSIGIVLIASPTLGSSYAQDLSKIGKLYGNQIADQLKPSNALLKDIDNRFRALIQKNSFECLVGAEACEQLGPLRVPFVPFFRMKAIVDADSGSRYFGELKIIPETDHSSIAKPSSAEHQSHRYLQEFYIHQYKEKKIPESSQTDRANSTETTDRPDPIFEVYSPTQSKYYVTRGSDDELLELLEKDSVWIYGQSGVGKTSAAKRAIELLGQRTKEIHLGHVNENSVREQLLTEIIYALSPDEVLGGKDLQQRAMQLLKDTSAKTTIPIFIDEVPISTSESTSAVAQAILQIIDTAKQVHGIRVNFLISSIARPPSGPTSGKMNERLRFKEINLWNDAPLETLFDLIASELKIGANDLIEKEQIISKAKGKPRFIKSIFRNYIRQDPLSRDMQIAIQRAELEAVS